MESCPIPHKICIFFKNKKERGRNLSLFYWGLQRQFPAAVIANALILIQGDLLIAAAEDTAGFMLPQNDGIALSIDFQGIAAGHVQRLAQLNGQSNASQVVNMSDNAGRFHKNVPPIILYLLTTVPILPFFTGKVNHESTKSIQRFSSVFVYFCYIKGGINKC